MYKMDEGQGYKAPAVKQKKKQQKKPKLRKQSEKATAWTLLVHYTGIAWVLLAHIQ